MRGPVKGILAWLAFIAIYYILYVYTLSLDIPHFEELLNASVVGEPLNVSQGYKLALVATSPFNPLEDFAYSSVLVGYFLNFVISVALFSLYSLWALMVLRSSRAVVTDFFKYSVSLPLLSSYVYVFSEYFLTGVVITGTSTFGVTTLFSPLISVADLGLVGYLLWAITGLTALVFVLYVAQAIALNTPEVLGDLVALSMIVIFLDIAYFSIKAIVNERGLWRKLLVVFITFASSVLAYVFYLSPTPYGINVNHIGALLILFTLGFGVARARSSNQIY